MYMYMSPFALCREQVKLCREQVKLGSQYDAGPCVALRHATLPALVDAGLELESILAFHCVVTLVDAV